MGEITREEYERTISKIDADIETLTQKDLDKEGRINKNAEDIKDFFTLVHSIIQIPTQMSELTSTVKLEQVRLQSGIETVVTSIGHLTTQIEKKENEDKEKLAELSAKIDRKTQANDTKIEKKYEGLERRAAKIEDRGNFNWIDFVTKNFVSIIVLVYIIWNAYQSTL